MPQPALRTVYGMIEPCVCVPAVHLQLHAVGGIDGRGMQMSKQMATRRDWRRLGVHVRRPRDGTGGG
jgi:hypothetical protein